VVNFVLVDRVTIARVHADFLGDPTETDVITFPYGEILICPAVARERAAEYCLVVENEVLLYALHGLLHLCGYDDRTPKAAKEMAIVQTRLQKRLVEGQPPA
jgi:probable rRNA maturation factor